MDKLLSLTIGDIEINAPAEIPQGGLNTAQNITETIVLLIFVLAVILTLFFMLWGGIKWLTSQGDKTKVDAARKTLVYSVIGLILVFLSYFIVNFITDFFSVSRIGIR